MSGERGAGGRRGAGGEHRAVADVARVLGERIGLRVDGAARDRLERTILDRARRRAQAVAAYAATLEGDDAEVGRLIDAITVQESRFFRDPAHFAAVVPVLRAAPRGVVWSAGCANGQEPWSLAMLLEETGADGWHVLATDVSAAALARTAAGVYRDAEVATLTAARRTRFLRREDRGWAIDEELRRRVTVRRHNLVDPPPGEAGECRLVLCRNVLIYLRPQDAERALAVIREVLPPDGRLVLGAGELLPAGRGGFVPERCGAVYLYRPAGADPQARPATPEPAAGERPAAPAATPRPVAGDPQTALNLALARSRMDAGEPPG